MPKICNEADKKIHVISMRLTDSEMQTILRKIGKKTTSEYVRGLLMQATGPCWVGVDLAKPGNNRAATFTRPAHKPTCRCSICKEK